MLSGSDLLDLAALCLGAEGLAFWNQGWRFGIPPEELRLVIESKIASGEREGDHWASSPGSTPGWLIVWFSPTSERPDRWREMLAGFSQQLGTLGNDKLWRERFDLVADAVLLLDADFRVQYVNRAAATEERKHQTKDFQIGSHLFEIYPEAEGSAFHRAYQRALESGEPASITEYYAPLDMWAEQQLFPDRHGLWIFSRNVSDIRNTQARLSKTEETHQALESVYELEHARLEMVMEGVDLGVWLCDLPFSNLVWDARCKAHYGLPPDADVTIDTFYQCMVEEDREPTKIAIERAIDRAGPYDMVHRIFGPDGIARWVRAIGRTTYDLQGRPVRFDGISLDVSREHQAELARQRTEERCVSLVRATSSVVWSCDAHGRFVEPQAEWELYTGIAWPKHQGHGWKASIHTEDIEALTVGFKEAAQTRHIFLGQARIWSREHQSYRHNEVKAVPLLTECEAVREWVGSTTDIHDKYEAELALVHASRMKTQFLTNMSHELRTPMAGVQGMLDLLYDTPLTEGQKECLETIYDCSRSLLTVLDDVLDLSRIEAGKLTFNERVYDLGLKISKTVSLFRLQAQERGLYLKVTTGEDVPMKLLGDPDRIRQLLTNLVSNALKFTHQGGVELSVSRRNSRLHFAVNDTGIGISESDLKRLFQPFVQIESSTSRKYGGTGLGLSIVRRLVDLMGGTLGAISTPGMGSTFWFEIPIKEPSADQITQELQSVVVERALPQAKVLVVEDNSMIRKILVAQVSKLGLQVESVERGQLALEIVSTSEFDIILMDCQMPEIDGYETTARLRAQGCRTPVIALTAHAMSGERERCLNAGMDDYLTKPLSIQELRQRLEHWLIDAPLELKPA